MDNRRCLSLNVREAKAVGARGRPARVCTTSAETPTCWSTP
jgi:hypothetical protein